MNADRPKGHCLTCGRPVTFNAIMRGWLHDDPGFEADTANADLGCWCRTLGRDDVHLQLGQVEGHQLGQVEAAKAGLRGGSDGWA